MRRFAVFLLVLTVSVASPAPLPAQPPAEQQDPAPAPLLLDDHSGGPVLGPERIRVDAEGKTFVDPSSDTVFPAAMTVVARSGDVIHLTATGSGVRKKLIYKVYAAALYVDALAPLGTVPVNTIASSDIARRMVMVFLRDVEGKRLKEGMRESFENTIYRGKPGPELSAELDTFFSWMDAGIKKGQTIELTYLPGEGLYTTVAGVMHPVVTRPDIARSIWLNWVGV
ncbi:MAG TPA: chalcone isomerase family protein, partial [Candidatus Eisenbacteria bacterium]